MATIREREWIKHLPDGFVIYFYLKTHLGELLSFTAALLKDGECITRYDNAHGFAHRDVRGRKAADTITKQTYSGLTSKEVLHYANQDLTENYAKHYEYYQSH